MHTLPSRAASEGIWKCIIDKVQALYFKGSLLFFATESISFLPELELLIFMSFSSSASSVSEAFEASTLMSQVMALTLLGITAATAVN